MLTVALKAQYIFKIIKIKTVRFKIIWQRWKLPGEKPARYNGKSETLTDKYSSTLYISELHTSMTGF